VKLQTKVAAGEGFFGPIEGLKDKI
jgi:hypothetical protein